MLTKMTAFALLGLITLAPRANASTWEIDPGHSAVEFKIRHLMVSNVKGTFGKVAGIVQLDDTDVTKSTVEATIDVTSISTGEPKRDTHLRSPDFFDVAKYPTMTFKSTRVQKAGGKRLKVTGMLTIHGITRSVTLDVDGPTAGVKDPYGNVKSGATATTKIKRSDFGLTWNAALESGGVVVGDDVSITLELELLRKDKPAATAKQ